MSDLDRVKRERYEYPPKGTPCHVCSCKIHPDNVAWCIRDCEHITCNDGSCHKTCDECGEVTNCKDCMTRDPDTDCWFCGDECKMIYTNREVERMKAC